MCVGLFVALIGGFATSLGIAQDTKPGPLVENAPGTQKDRVAVRQPESDADFIRRISKELRGTDPTPTEMHFFVASKDPGRRQKLIDLLIQERQAKKISIGSDDSANLGDLLEAAKLRERIEKERLEYLRLKAKQAEKELIPPLPTKLNGVIEKIDQKDPTLLSISIGSDAGLAKNHTLDVYRLKPAPMYLGKIRILDVSAQKAVARRVGNLTADGPALKAGDNVTSSLTAPTEEKK